MRESNRDKARRLEKELREAERRHRAELRELRVERDRAISAMSKQATAFHDLTVRVAITYGTVTSRAVSGKANGYCLTVRPFIDPEYAKRWKVYGENDPDGTSRIGVALRDTPEDGMSEAEIAEAREKAKEGR